jgi:TolA-binding protein
MRSAFRGQEYSDAFSCADLVKADALSTQDEAREADYVKAKSYLMTNERTKAFAIFKTLAAKPSTPEGAEAAYMMIQDAYDQGRFDTVESKVYDFAGKAGDQSYWLAKAFIVLGDTFAELGNLTQAKATFESVKNGYTPEGDTDDVLDAVEMRLAKLKNLKK